MRWQDQSSSVVVASKPQTNHRLMPLLFLLTNNRSTMAAAETTAFSNKSELESWLDLPLDQADSLLQALDPEAHVRTFWGAGTRPDGRLFTQARPTTVVSSLLKHSAGSALVKQGDTKVLVAMTTQIGQPSPDIPDHGDVVVSVSSDGHADLLQAWLQRMLDETLPPRLNLLTGKACIRLVVTVMILQDSGNLMDAALLGCMAAWKDTTLPSMQELKEVDGKLWWKEEPSSSLSKKSPEESEGSIDYRLSLTMGIVKVGEENKTTFLVDPTTIEAKQLEGSLTVVVNVSTQTIQVEYSGSVSLSATELALAAKMASGSADELVKLL